MLNSQNIVLAKIITWAFDNGIEIKVGKFVTGAGLKDQIEITLIKNGRQQYVRFLDWHELDAGFVKSMIEKSAFELCLTRLNLV